VFLALQESVDDGEALEADQTLGSNENDNEWGELAAESEPLYAVHDPENEVE
jgi:hypothetical protein